MAKIVMAVLISMVSLQLFSYQDSSFSLFTPSALAKGEMEISIVHRFYGAVDDDVWDTFLGMNTGANVGLAFRRNLLHRLELKGGYTRSGKRLELGVSWQPSLAEFPFLFQTDVAFVSFDQLGIEKRRKNLVYIISGQSRIYEEWVVISSNLGYDGYYERFINGYALHVKYFNNLSLVGEYYPVWDRESASAELERYIGKYDTYSFGVKYDTWGHHFMFSLGNGTYFHPASQSLGTNNGSDLFFGFNIQRRF